MDYVVKAKGIIEQNMYISLATCGEDGKPWSAVVFFAYDNDYNLYFLSAIDSRHAENILKKPDVSGIIFNSTQALGYDDEVQIEGVATLVPKSNVSEVINIYCKRAFPESKMKPTERYRPEEFSEPSELRFFKIEITGAYTTGPEKKIKLNLH